MERKLTSEQIRTIINEVVNSLLMDKDCDESLATEIEIGDGLTAYTSGEVHYCCEDVFFFDRREYTEEIADAIVSNFSVEVYDGTTEETYNVAVTPDMVEALEESILAA